MRRQSEEKVLKATTLVRQFIDDLDIGFYFSEIIDWIEEDYTEYTSSYYSEAEWDSIDDMFTAKMVRALMDATSEAESYAENELQKIAPKLGSRIARTIHALKKTRNCAIRTRLVDGCIRDLRKAVKPVLDECIEIFLESSEPSKVLDEVRDSVSMPVPSAVEKSLLYQYKQLCDLRLLAADSLETMLCGEKLDKSLTLLAAAMMRSVEPKKYFMSRIS